MSIHDDDSRMAANFAEPFATTEMCRYCFDVIIFDLSNVNGVQTHSSTPQPPPPFMEGLPPMIECPLFITWDKRDAASSVDYRLRGCIGTLSPRPLATAVRDFALTSAFRDQRFDPMRIEEVPNLRVGVSLLVKYEACSDVYDWQVGVHGILIKFHTEGQQYSATYLPEVAKEQRWRKEEAVKSLIRKAGFRGTVDVALLGTIHCTRYQSSKCRLTYEEYIASLNGVDPLARQDSSQKRSCVVA